MLDQILTNRVTRDEANAEADALKAMTPEQIREQYDLFWECLPPEILVGDYVQSISVTGFVLSIYRGTATVLERSIYWPSGREQKAAVKHIRVGLKALLRKKNK